MGMLKYTCQLPLLLQFLSITVSSVLWWSRTFLLENKVLKLKKKRPPAIMQTQKPKWHRRHSAREGAELKKYFSLSSNFSFHGFCFAHSKLWMSRAELCLSMNVSELRPSSCDVHASDTLYPKDQCYPVCYWGGKYSPHPCPQDSPRSSAVTFSSLLLLLFSLPLLSY